MTGKVFSNDTGPTMPAETVAPTGRVAMIGAGQLARMTHQAGIDYGIAVHVLAGSVDDPAVTAGAAYTLGRPDHLVDLRAASAHGQVTTFDHELVRLDLLDMLVEGGVAVRPNPVALGLSCDKLLARRTLDRLGVHRVPVPAFAPVRTVGDIAEFAETHGWPVVIKARSGGYDGRGVQVITGGAEARRLLPETATVGDPCWLVEQHLDLAAEFAIVMARNPSGFIARYPPIATHQHDGICRELSIPADLPATVADTAGRLAESVIAGIDATGICAVEFFWTTDGRLLLNELALRPHNSGHVTIEACATSQFHQHLRAVLDWPLGGVDLLSPAATVNLIAGPHPADMRAGLPGALRIPNTHVHLYQKQPRPGRKIGHVTALAATTEEALDLARTAANLLLPGEPR